MQTQLRQLQQALRAGPGASVWSAQHEAVYDALIDAGKLWATGTLPDNGRGWREALEPFVLEYLDRPGSDLREAALRTLADYWALPSYRDLAHHFMRTDPDPDVRAAGLAAWSNYFRNTRDALVLDELRTLLLDDTQPNAVRAGAYRGVLTVSGYLDTVSRTDVSDVLDVFQDVDRRVDWHLVDRLTEGTRA